MEKIKLTNNKITLKDDKVSCECCGNCQFGTTIQIELQAFWVTSANSGVNVNLPTPYLDGLGAIDIIRGGGQVNNILGAGPDKLTNYPKYYLGGDNRTPPPDVNLSDYPVGWGLRYASGGQTPAPGIYDYIVSDAIQGDDKDAPPSITSIVPAGPQGTDYSLGLPKNCDLKVFNPETNEWDFLYHIDFSAYWSDEVNRQNILLPPIQILPKYVTLPPAIIPSTGRERRTSGGPWACIVTLKLETPISAENTGKPVVFYTHIYRSGTIYDRPPHFYGTQKTISTRHVWGPPKVEYGKIRNARSVRIVKLIYTENGVTKRSPIHFTLDSSSEGIPGNSRFVVEDGPSNGDVGLPTIDTSPPLPTDLPVPWELQTIKYLPNSGPATTPLEPHIYEIALARRTSYPYSPSNKFFRPLSVIGHPDYSPNLIPVVKGLLGPFLESQYNDNTAFDTNQTTNLFKPYVDSFGRLRNTPEIKYDQIPWFDTYKQSPCNSDGIILKTTPENTSTNLVILAQSDFGGTSKSGLPVFNDDGQLVCGPVPTISHGPLLLPTDVYNTSNLDFLSGGTVTLISNRLLNPISVGPGATTDQNRIVTFYAPAPEQESWGRGNPAARISRYLKFTTNWVHTDYDVWIEFAGSVNTVSNPTLSRSSIPYVVVIPSGQTIAYTKCPFSNSDIFLQPKVSNQVGSGQTIGLANGGWTIQFVKWIFNSNKSGLRNTLFTEQNHSISVEIMSYEP